MRDLLSNASKDQSRAKLSGYGSALRHSRVYRTGRDEFALILMDAKADGALAVDNEIRVLIRETTPSKLPDFSISFGVCTVEDSSSPEDWLDLADEALYIAKDKGGDAAWMAS